MYSESVLGLILAASNHKNPNVIAHEMRPAMPDFRKLIPGLDELYPNFLYVCDNTILSRRRILNDSEIGV